VNATPPEAGPVPAPHARAYRTPYRRAPDNPWWIFPFLGRVPDVPPERIRLLGVIALALLFESYDQAMLTAALKQIAESFGVAESELGALLGRVHLGSVAAFLIVPFADVLGRRRVFLGSLVVVSVSTGLSGFARSPGEFEALQMLSRVFMVTCTATAFVMVTEEFPAEHRGWGIGILGALAAFGYGLGLLAFAAIDVLPFGWRSLYAAGLVPLLLLPLFRRRIPETRRFAEHADRRSATGAFAGWWRPMRALLVHHPARAALVGAIALLAVAGHGVGFSFAAYHVQTAHGWAPGQYTAMAVAAGLVGVVGHPWAGRMADTSGRRRVGLALLGGFPLLALAFYQGPGWALPFAWIGLTFTLTGGITILRALGSELFPTSARGTASGWLQLAEAVGRSGGLFAVAWATPAGASNTPAISAIVFASLAAALLLRLLPETGGRELEEISAER
jgi:MFS family permease